MATPRPSSPTSLLWAHQIKRENGHLLNRIQKLESAHAQADSRLKAAESAANAHASEDIAALAEQVKALDGREVDRRLDRMERDVISKLDDVQTETEAVVLKVSSMERDDAVAEEERRKAFNKEKALLKRVAEVEENLKRYEHSLDQVGRRIDDQSVGTIKAQLSSLTKQVEQEGSEMKLLEESILALETANAELKKANERLAKEVENLASRPPPAVGASAERPAATSSAKPIAKRTAPTADLDEDDSESQAPPPKKKKKKSHKWSGGGADKDIIRQSSEFDVASRGPATPHKLHAKPAPRSAPKAAPKSVPAKERKTQTQATQKQGSVKAAQSKKASAQKPPPKSAAKPVAKQPQRQPAAPPGKPIIRSGKGWFEVAMSPSDSDEESSDELVTIHNKITGLR